MVRALVVTNSLEKRNLRLNLYVLVPVKITQQHVVLSA